jgi:hypothetical protein
MLLERYNALQRYEKAVEIDPSDPWLYFLKGDALARTICFRSSCGVLTHGVTEKEENRDFLFFLINFLRFPFCSNTECLQLHCSQFSEKVVMRVRSFYI